MPEGIQVTPSIINPPKIEPVSKFSKMREFLRGMVSIFDLSGTYYNDEIEETIKKMSPDRIIGSITKNICQNFNDVSIKLELGNVGGSPKQTS